MEQKAPEEKILRRVLSEIIREYSIFEYKEKTVYIKHFRQFDQSELESHYDSVFNRAKKQGLPTEEETIEMLKTEGLWTEEDESEYLSQEKYLNNLKETKKNLIIPSQIEQIEKDIEESNKNFQKLLSKKNSLLSETCESYAKKKNNDYSLYLSFYKNEKCTEKFYTKEDFESVSKGELNDLLEKYVLETKHLSIDNIKYLAISGVFSMYYGLLGKENLYTFFQKPVYEYTYYQLNLLNYARILNTIVENAENMPDSVKEHPDRILDFAEAKRKNKDIISKTKDKQGASIVGATKKDMDEMGVSDPLSVSPFDLAKKKGSLTIEDFQNFS